MLGDQDGWGTNRLSKADSILGTGMSQNLSRGRRHACQRTKKIRGYFSKSRFVAINNNKLVDEIALNPALFIVLPTKEIFQTMAHEMVHQWQFHFGKPSRSSYHNKECASKMESIGLMQSDTRREGGKKTGQNMGDYIIPGSAMDNASRKLLEDGFEIKWSDVIQAR